MGVDHVGAPVFRQLYDAVGQHADLAPFAQARDHVAAHGIAGHQACRGAAARPGALDVRSVGLGDRRPDRVVFQPGGEGIEEAGDLAVGDRTHAVKGFVRPGHGLGGGIADPFGHMQQVAGGLHDQQLVPGHKGLG